MFSARGAHGGPCERACTIREACTFVFLLPKRDNRLVRGGKNGSNLGDLLNQGWVVEKVILSGNGSTVVISRYTFDFYIFISEIGDLLAICFTHIGNYLVDHPTQLIDFYF